MMLHKTLVPACLREGVDRHAGSLALRQAFVAVQGCMCSAAGAVCVLGA
ncbi:hypothetical protein [Paenibacillus chitinolyticus]